MAQDDYSPEIISVYDDVTTPPENFTGQETSSIANGTTQYNGETEIRSESREPEKDGIRQEAGKYRFFSDKRWKVALGIILILVAAYLCISTFSYLTTAESDQSELENTSLSTLANTTGSEIKNIGGPAGALYSHRLFTYGLGMGIIPVFVYLILVGIWLLDLRKCNFWSLAFKTLLLAITLSIVFGLLFYSGNATVPLGGYHGYYINSLLIKNFSWIGAVCVSLALIGCVVGVYFYDIAKLWRRYRLGVEKRRERRRKQYEERQRMMQATDEHFAEASEVKVGNCQSDETEEQKDLVASIHSHDPLAALSNHGSGTTESENIENRIPDIPNQPITTEIDTGSAIVTKTDSLSETTLQEEAIEEPEKENKPETETDLPADSQEMPAEVKEDILKIKESAEIEKGTGENRHFDPTAELPDYKMPTAELLKDRPVNADNVDISEIEDKKNQIIEALSKYGIGISKIEATVGPTVTMYEIVPAEGVKIATIKRLEEDIAMALAALSTRIIAPIPGKSAIGIEVPNRDPQTVSVKTIFESKAFQETDYELPIALGVTIDNRVFIADLAKMPHLLVAGATGKGKSVGMNVIINSLLYKKHPSELKLVLIDPKMVEFYPYRKLDRHYLAQVADAENAIITDTSKVVDTLNSLCIEMDDRYRLLQQAEVVKITHYNDLICQRKLSPREGHRFLPYIVIVVDEYADLLMTAGKEIETPIARLAQKARAVGIHVIIATQRPSSNIITGVIKGNFPARIAFKVTSYVDSNIILGNSGAFQLIGNGDMLISQDGELNRVQCAFISTDEIKAVAGFISSQRGFGGPLILPDPPVTGDKNGLAASGDIGEEDSLLEEVARAVVTSGSASTSNIQRRYSIGYNRAGRIMDQLQALGIVGPAQGGKVRDILVDSYQLEEILQNRY